MRGHLKVMLCAPLALWFGCEDGPQQTFNPANTVQNSGGSSYVDLIPKQPLGGSTAGANPLIRCTPEKQRKVWTSELIKPIVPIRGAAGLDGTKNLTYTGLSIDEVEAALCQGAGDPGLSWFGEQGELAVYWSTSTRLVTEFLIFNGYRGTLSLTDPDNNDSWTFSMENKPIDVNGQPLRWNWRDTKARAANATKIYNAMMKVYAPDQLPPGGVSDCTATGGCIATILGAGQTGAVAIVPLGFIQFYFDLGVDSAAGKDILTRIYIPIQKNFAYSTLPVTLQLPGAQSADGIVMSGKVGTKSCTVKPGIRYRDFIDSCVAVTGDATKDQAEVTKFLSGLRHSSEEYLIDVVGVDPEFLSLRVKNSPDPASINDKDRPEDDDPLDTLTIDQQLRGAIVNDYPGEDITKKRDNHGSGLVNLAYAILVQQALDAAGDPKRPKHPIGDPSCNLTPDGLPVDAKAEGCTGMEGIITTADPNAVPASSPWQNAAWGPTGIQLTSARGLAPANNQLVSFDDSPGQGNINDDYWLVTWAGSAQRVIKVLGKGERNAVPAGFREPRNYATLWMQALTQYLIARGNVGKAVTLQDVLDAGPGGKSGHHIDPEYFFFDAPDGSRQQFDSAEYIDIDYATLDHPWYDFRIVVDSNGGILNQLTFDYFPMRGERALLGAITPAGKPLGSDGTLLFTNIFGSTVLSSGWTEPVKPKAPYLTAYDCASADTENMDTSQLTAFKTACGANNGPPVDATGKIIRDEHGEPWLKGYKGGFLKTGTVFHIGRNVGLLPTDLISFVSRDVNLLQAKISFRTKTNPYDPSSADGPPLVSPMNYVLPTDDTGFFIPINASRDRFVKEEEIYATGDATSYVLGTVPVLVDGVEQPGLRRLASADSSDFLGEAFVCMSDGDLLAVRMFTPSEKVMAWLMKHPNAMSDCNIIVDYHAFGTVISRVTSIANGVIVNFTLPSGITAGANNSVVSDVDLFAPGL